MVAITDKYKHVLVAFMKYDHKAATYNQETEFTCWQFGQRIYAATLTNVAMAWSIHHPTALPPLCCASTLFYWKKALLSFMPHKYSHWDPVSNQGNLTSS